ncbi:MAG: hypothetical protein CMC96_12190 [Flavobacteriales bacterium]|nr:hypothetical protein [Flavobacteriales bacterium]|tara:strand:+ start:219 stop:680 length:462 start_codon:yes stop_codon:yes gene_type:complete
MTTQKTMKTIFTLCALMTFSNLCFGQCKNFIKNVDFSPLQSFEYCSEVKVAQMNSSSKAQIKQKLETNKRYRILADAQSHIGELQLNVINQKGDTVSIEVKTNENRYWEIVNDQKEKVEIQMYFTKTSTTGINTAGCVVLAIGEMENSNLVEK